MNIRKNIDYSEMYAELDKAMAADIPQMLSLIHISEPTRPY